MKRMYDERVAKLIEKVSQNGITTEVGGNLEVDGSIQLNGSFKPIHTYVNSEDDAGKLEIFTEYFDSEGNKSGLCSLYGYFGTYSTIDGITGVTYCLNDGSLYFNSIEILGTKFNFIIEDQTIAIDGTCYQRKAYRHTIEIKGTNISLCFTTETINNNPIDSLQDLITQLANTKLSCSGYIQTDIVSKINIGDTATKITFETSGGQKTIASLGTITIEDDVTTI